MNSMSYGRKLFRLSKGSSILTSMSITEKPQLGEDETTFTQRLTKKYGDLEGTIEIVFKQGRPNYAIVTLD